MPCRDGQRVRAALVLIVLAALATGGCAERKARKAFVESVAGAHGSAAWQARAALAFDIDIQDGLEAPAHAQFVCAVHGPQVRAEFADGTRVVWDGRSAWVSPEAADPAQACRRVRAWPWLLTAPLRLADDGVKLRALGALPHGDVDYPSARMTFPSGQPQPPSPGYIVYTDPQTHHVVAVAYVGSSDDGSSAWVARSVTFDKFATVDGVALPTDWKFWPWTRSDGPCGDLIGQATVTNLRFVDVDAATFAIPTEGIPLVDE